MSSESNVKGYAPLPQSISTDTEDDEDEHHPHHQRRDRINSKDDDRSRTSDATTISQNGRFYPLDETKNTGSRTRNGRTSFGYSSDNIPIMILNGPGQDDLWKRRDMSLLRKCCLVFSIILCIATILVFLFVIPCDNSSICLYSSSQPKTSLSWDKVLNGVELHGKITVVLDEPYNLIFLLRGQQFGDLGSTSWGGKQQIDKNGGGVLSMKGTSGIPLWWVALQRLPIDISCDLIDTDGSGKPDCLVSCEGGLLVSIEPITGTIHWKAEVPSTSELPLVLSDLDADRIHDLIGVELTNTSQNLVFLSGKTGKLLMRREIPDCQYVKLNRIDFSFVLTYTCYNGDNNQSVTILLKNFVESQNLKEIHRRYILDSTRSPKPIYPNQTSPTSWDLTAHYRLYVINNSSDDCPAVDCRTSVNLTLRNNINESSIWNHTSASSFVTKPAIINTTDLPYIAGFALKFWSWSPNTFSTDDAEEQIVHQHKIMERVSFLYVNRTEVHEMKPSVQELVQLCRGHDCQPNLMRQTRSILIANLNGVMELISYGSSYSQTENLSKANLTSRVQIVKLEQIF
ncbi:uncharacterized protein LOC106641812 isoform X2 [Copidosoma floridanum]|uniref:uncharacterized protein LOC106641812 isoform X2 n=1 Tax=Copidosoma floridanum TaxID=29053 RepID=UPI000C6FA458|nr:uncharacterized protein LOC106641812 isoform X2 [Copidosoma floridanum]